MWVRNHKLGMQYRGGAIQMDIHPRLQQALIIAGLCVTNHKLVGFLIDQQVNLYPTIAGGGNGLQQGFIRDEIRGA